MRIRLARHLACTGGLVTRNMSAHYKFSTPYADIRIGVSHSAPSLVYSLCWVLLYFILFHFILF